MVNPMIGNPFATLGIDFYGFFLPWIFTFAIVYGLLYKLKLFGDINPRISAALAFVIAFFVTAVGGPQLALFFTSIFGGASMFLAGILVVILFAAMLGYGGGDKKFQHTGALVIVIIIGVILFLASSGSFVSVNVISPGMAGIVFWLVIIIVAIYFVMGKTEGGGGGAAKEK
ncbi:MAG: hypothetical protein NT120_02320 [Candidatus Aenigmarchaeota archaeon]|nr:hypothetical protein [Candidatus Aenigmarchaeota archaeon]